MAERAGAHDQHLAKVGKCLARACVHKSCLTLVNFILALPSKLFTPLQELVPSPLQTLPKLFPSWRFLDPRSHSKLVSSIALVIFNQGGG